jgi:hypothetical protein
MTIEQNVIFHKINIFNNKMFDKIINNNNINLFLGIGCFILSIIMLVLGVIVNNKYIVKKSEIDCKGMPAPIKKGDECYTFDENTCRKGTFDGNNCSDTKSFLPFVLLSFAVIFFGAAGFLLDRFFTKRNEINDLSHFNTEMLTPTPR